MNSFDSSYILSDAVIISYIVNFIIPVIIDCTHSTLVFQQDY